MIISTGVYGRAGCRVHDRTGFAVHRYRRTAKNIQRAAHKIYDIRCQTDTAVSMGAVTAMMITGKGGCPDDDGSDTDGGFQNRVFHFSSPVL